MLPPDQRWLYKFVVSPKMDLYFLDVLKSWDYVAKSPYSYSFYDRPGKTWDCNPDGIRRIADHWNFTTRGALHCPTDIPVRNGHWALGEWDGAVFRILEVRPKVKSAERWANVALLADELTPEYRKELAKAGFSCHPVLNQFMLNRGRDNGQGIFRSSAIW